MTNSAIFTSLSSLSPEHLEGIYFGSVYVSRWIIPYSLSNKTTIGIDPGKNFGIAIASPKQIIAFGGSLPLSKDQHEYGMVMLKFMREFLRTIQRLPEMGIVEGASYGDHYGQVTLAEIRYSMMIALSEYLEYGEKLRFVPPTMVRKSVLGSGKIKGKDVFPDINPNAADAVIISLYSQI